MVLKAKYAQAKLLAAVSEYTKASDLLSVLLQQLVQWSYHIDRRSTLLFEVSMRWFPLEYTMAKLILRLTCSLP